MKNHSVVCIVGRMTRARTCSHMRDFVNHRIDYVGRMMNRLIVQSVTDTNDFVRDSQVRADPTFSRAEIFTYRLEPITRHVWLQHDNHRTFWHGGRLELFTGILGEGSFRSSVGTQTRGGQSGVYSFVKEKFFKAFGYSVSVPLFDNEYLVHVVWGFSAIDATRFWSSTTMGDQWCFDPSVASITHAVLVCTSVDHLPNSGTTLYHECWDGRLEYLPLLSQSGDGEGVTPDPDPDRHPLANATRLTADSDVPAFV